MGDCHFHVKRAFRDACGFEASAFSARGDVVLVNGPAAHRFAHLLSERVGVHVGAAELRALGLAHEVLHAVVGLYRRANPGVLAGVLARLEERLGPSVDDALRAFLGAFPPPTLYAGAVTVDEVLAASHGGVGGREAALEELLLLWVTNQNPVYAPIAPVVADDELASTPYQAVVASAGERLADEPRVMDTGETLLDLLLAPARRAPSSIWAQLRYMRETWGVMLEEIGLLDELLVLEDTKREEEWLGHTSFAGHDGGPPVTELLSTWTHDHEYEAFSPDTDWMPRVVMIAKSTFVWLHQLSRAHGRPIRTLADIPEEEIAKLASWGMTALWLIGVWERSAASVRIKHRMGNPDAVASAYSLESYEIASDLGGHAAYEVLRERCSRHGVRLASDMVPNHMGIDSSWVVHHPERFLSLTEPPFPSYRFSGPDLSHDPSVGVYLEDGYWARTDAAVVFKRVDRHTGDAVYVYHGNDGTNMPWNDTAQLDYTRADVREAVIQTIIHVARMFPILRFDAAMTLAKRHIQRLWFPLPGTGGAIPSRADHALSKVEFDALIPREFWREVVDRVAVEAPNTLLLAEAFWLMEGYFVRTLGMHRVYNSAFMNMLHKEQNQEFRLLIKNVIEFEPRVLERFVNFMNNPDEETAIAQFGDGDKYFGVAVLLATLPGLPMFGHGQVEGFTEKYGMEYKRPRLDEEPKGWLVDRHARDIFPLLRQRHRFSSVDAFYLYDCVTPAGHVHEDVIAYSNGVGGRASLVLFNNRYAEAHGFLRESAPCRLPSGEVGRASIGAAMGLAAEPGLYVIARDAISGAEHLFSLEAWSSRGFEVHLRAFQHRVLVDFEVVAPTAERPWDELYRALEGRAVPSLEEALVNHRFRAIHDPVAILLSREHTDYVLGAPREAALAATEARFLDLRKGIAWHRTSRDSDAPPTFEAAMARASEPPPANVSEPTTHKRGAARPHHVDPDAKTLTDDLARIAGLGTGGPPFAAHWHLVVPAARVLALIETLRVVDIALGATLIDDEDFRLELLVRRALGGEVTDARAGELADIVRALSRGPADLYRCCHALIERPLVQAFLMVHTVGQTTWFNQERMECLLVLLAARGAQGSREALDDVAGTLGASDGSASPTGDQLERLLLDMSRSGYDFSRFRAIVSAGNGLADSSS